MHTVDYPVHFPTRLWIVSAATLHVLVELLQQAVAQLCDGYSVTMSEMCNLLYLQVLHGVLHLEVSCVLSCPVACLACVCCR